MSAHTKGEWLLAGENSDFVYALGPNGGNSFWAAVSSAGSDRISNEEKAANARLMATAPKLLAALIALDDCYCSAGPNLTKAERHQHRLTLIAARAAVAEATRV